MGWVVLAYLHQILVPNLFPRVIFLLTSRHTYCLMYSFGNIIRKAREEKGLFLRQVAAEMEIDQAIISKFERGDRKPTKEQVLKFAKFYKIDKDELLVAWLSDKVAYDLQNENLADKVLKAAEQKIKYRKK